MKVFVVSINQNILSQLYPLFWILNLEEQNRFLMLKNDEVKRQYLISKILRRYFLSFYCNWRVAPNDWTFITLKNDKPALSAEFGHLKLQFNAAHCSDAFTIAIQENFPVGVDIEPVNCMIDTMLATSFSTHKEQMETNRLPLENVRNHWVTLWTLKEAYVKYLGIGMEADFKQVEISASKVKLLHSDYSNPEEVILHNTSFELGGSAFSVSTASYKDSVPTSFAPEIQLYNTGLESGNRFIQ